MIDLNTDEDIIEALWSEFQDAYGHRTIIMIWTDLIVRGVTCEQIHARVKKVRAWILSKEVISRLKDTLINWNDLKVSPGLGSLYRTIDFDHVLERELILNWLEKI